MAAPVAVMAVGAVMVVLVALGMGMVLVLAVILAAVPLHVLRRAATALVGVPLEDLVVVLLQGLRLVAAALAARSKEWRLMWLMCDPTRLQSAGIMVVFDLVDKLVTCRAAVIDVLWLGHTRVVWTVPVTLPAAAQSEGLHRFCVVCCIV